ncbi:MAG: CDP-glycerol glycerophosphotransferase family protein [Actinomycetota bacterium]
MSASPSSDSWLRRQSKRAARSLARRMRDFGQVEPAGFDLADVPSADIALYFPDGPPKLYQLTQWLPVFEGNNDVTTIVIVRQVDAFNALRGTTPLRVILVPRYEDLMALLDRANFGAVVYVNNGWTNFQALSFQRAVHIHVNHGESDKIFVAGQAAIERHEAALAWFDQSHLVRVGRPQLDLEVSPALSPTDRTTITYAPTWEGEDEANNYSSVDVYGVQIIQAMVEHPASRIVYKPHPRVADSDDPAIRSQHRAIVAAVNQAASDDPSAGHCVLEGADMLAVIRSTDVLIADVSSVSLDFLYLKPGAPLVITDRRTDRSGLLAESPVASVCHVVDAHSIDQLSDDLRAVVTSTGDASRRSMRDHYFDDLEPGESTQRFWAELDSAIREHDQALQSLSRIRTVSDGTAS